MGGVDQRVCMVSKSVCKCCNNLVDTGREEGLSSCQLGFLDHQ